MQEGRSPTKKRLVLATVSTGLLCQSFSSMAFLQPTPLIHREAIKVHRMNHIAMMADPIPGSREDDLASKIELLRSAKKQGAGYEKFLEKSKGQTLSSTLNELKKTEGSKVLDAEELKMKKDKALYKDAAKDVSELNTGEFRRNLSQDSLDNRELFVDPDAYKQKYISQKKSGEDMMMEDYDNLMSNSEEFFNSKSVMMGAEELADLVKSTEEELKTQKKEGETTSGVGGSWSGNSDSESDTLKPKVSTWGVFERPKDISKAYGGGRRIGVGGYQMSPEERARKDEETRALLDEVLNGNSEEKRIEEEHAEEIDSAMSRASQLIRFGDRYGALEELQSIKDWLNPKSERGGRALLEYGMALETTGNQEGALSVYNLLVSKSRIADINKNAKALAAGIQAFTEMNFNVAEYQSQWIWDFPEIETDVRYETKYFKDMDADGMPASVEMNTLKSARYSLLRGIEYKRGISQSRVVKAIDFVASRSKELLNMQQGGDEIPELWQSQVGDLDSIPERLNGTWKLGLTVKGESIGYPDSGFLEIKCQESEIQSCTPFGLALLEQQGKYEFDQDNRELNTDFTSSKLLAGFIAAPWSASSDAQTMQIVLLDDELCVTREIPDKKQPLPLALSKFMVWKKEEELDEKGA